MSGKERGQDELSPLTKVRLFTAGVIIVSLVEIVSQLAKNEQGKFSFSLPTVILCAEFSKLALSTFFLLQEEGLSKAIKLLTETRIKTAFVFAIPALCYMASNNIAILAGRYMDGASQAVLNQLKTLVTGVLWFLVFRKPLAPYQIMALVLLVASAVASVFPTEEDLSEKMHVEFFGLVLMSGASFTSATAGCYTEWVYKNVGKAKSLHLQNIYMYLFGLFFNGMMYMRDSQRLAGADFFAGWNVCFMGLVMSVVFRYFTSIHKLFMSGASIYFCTLANVFVFNLGWSVQFVAAVILCTCAILLYNKPHVENVRYSYSSVFAKFDTKYGKRALDALKIDDTATPLGLLISGSGEEGKRFLLDVITESIRGMYGRGAFFACSFNGPDACKAVRHPTKEKRPVAVVLAAPRPRTPRNRRLSYSSTAGRAPRQPAAEYLQEGGRGVQKESVLLQAQHGYPRQTEPNRSSD
eukprot:gene423-588_t